MFLNPSTWYQGPETRDPGTRDQGPGTKDQGPGTRDQGPGPGTRGAGMGTVASMGKGTFKFPELLIVASLLQYSFGDDVLFLRA